MNFFGHAHVAVLAGVTAHGTVLGAVLPDLLGMVRARVDQDALDDDVRAGIALHHRADEAFHQHPAFAELQRDLREAARGIDLPAGAVRAVAHVGTELLLDGLLDGEVGPTFRASLAAASDLDEHVAPVDRWRQLRTWVATADPSDYAEPADVALRLHRILARRPRLAFDDDRRVALTQVLASHRGAVEAAAPRLFRDVAAGLSPG